MSQLADCGRRGLLRSLPSVLLLLLAVAAASAADRALLPAIRHEDLVVALAQRTAVVVEVSAPAGRRDHAHLPRTIAYDDVVAGHAKLPKDRRTLLVLCSDDAGRSRLPEVIADLQGRGYRNLERYSGGVRGWLEKRGRKDDGKTTRDDDGKTTRDDGKTTRDDDPPVGKQP